MSIVKLAINPLTTQDLERIEAIDLPGIEKHYLRLLAHCLFTFQAMCNGSTNGSFPDQKFQEEWLRQHPQLANEAEFVVVFLDQLKVASSALEDLAQFLKISPLELTLEHLIDASIRSHEASKE